MLFINYTEGTTPVIDTHTVQYHLFADYAVLRPVSAASSLGLVTSLSSCVTDLANSYACLRLQLNPSKTEFICFCTRHNLAKLPTECCSLTVCSSVIQCADVVRDHGVLLDSELSMQSHISKVTSACFYHLRTVIPRSPAFLYLYPGTSATTTSTKCRCSTCAQP